jgi:putative SOS response-associated peptidase YedK
MLIHQPSERQGTPAVASAFDQSSSYAISASPAQTLPVFRRDPATGQAVQSDLRWGLIPHYADVRPDLQPIHVRAETISEKRMFADAYRKRRCIVPMTEFILKDASKKWHAISRMDGAPFGVAGIWENWRDPLTLQWERTFAIITVPASKLIAAVHDRMPAILDNSEFTRWLGAEEDPPDLLKPFPSEYLSVSSFSRKHSRRA